MKAKTIAKAVLATTLFVNVSQVKEVEATSKSSIVAIKLKNYLGNQASVQLKITGQYYLSGYPNKVFTGNYTVKKNSEGNLELTSSDGESSMKLKSGFTLVPKTYGTNHMIAINNIPYLGNMQFTVENGVVRPINALPIEDYLKGVVPYEMDNLWELEAQKAQAVAARTFVLSKGQTVIDDTTSNQVYKGYNAAYKNSILAIEATQGKVLKSGGSYVSAVYSASNGGWILSNTNVWGNVLSSYLKAKPDEYSVRAGKHLNWWFSIEKKQIDTTKLDLTKPATWWNSVSETIADKAQMTEIKNYIARNNLLGTTSVDDFKITEITKIRYDLPPYDSNKKLAAEIQFRYFLKKNGTYVMDGNKIKTHTYTLQKSHDNMKLVFSSSQKSSYIQKVEETKTSFKVIGSGYGHGIGMSQWGAQQMAKEKKTYQEILAFYYNGTNLVTENTAFTGVIPATTSVIVKEDGKQPVQEVIPPKETEKPKPTIPNGVKTYTVVPGDTRASIAAKFGITLEQLTKWNNLTSPFILYKGDVLMVSDPNKTTAKPKDTTPPSEVSNVKTSVTTNSVTLTFTKSKESDFSHVEILRDGKVMASKVTGTSYQDKNLKEGTKYTYVIKTIDKTGNQSKGKSVTLTTKKTTPKPTTTNTKSGKVKASTLNMRSGAGTSYKVVTTLKKNQVVTINSVSGKWAYVTYGSKKGYVSTDHLTITTTTSSTPAKTSSTKTTTKTHTVKKGETLTSIAKTYKVSVKNIKSWNKLKNDTIKVGQKITVSP